MWWEVILDALKDTAILFPFLFLMYILIEVLEHNTGVSKPQRALTGRYAPILGGALGTLPMCGFSVMAAKLYRNRHITIGTLLAVFIATSDEALLVLITTPVLLPLDKLFSVLALIGVKFVLALAVGYLANALFKKSQTVQPLPAPCEHGEIPEVEEVHAHEHEEFEHLHEETDEEAHTHEHEHYDACKHTHKSKVSVYLVSPLLHALEVAAFVLLVNLAFGYLFFALGQENVVAFLQAGKWIQPLICPLIGLIPNCASSVVLAETFAVGGIEFGSLLAGLVTNAGLGALALFHAKKDNKIAALVLVFLYFLGVAAGYAVNAVGLLI